jgi:hypothetical protein
MNVLDNELTLSGVSQAIIMLSQTSFCTSSLKAKGLKFLKNVKVLKLPIHN